MTRIDCWWSLGLLEMKSLLLAVCLLLGGCDCPNKHLSNEEIISETNKLEAAGFEAVLIGDLACPGVTRVQAGKKLK